MTYATRMPHLRQTIFIGLFQAVLSTFAVAEMVIDNQGARAHRTITGAKKLDQST